MRVNPRKPNRIDMQILSELIYLLLVASNRIEFRSALRIVNFVCASFSSFDSFWWCDMEATVGGLLHIYLVNIGWAIFSIIQRKSLVCVACVAHHGNYTKPTASVYFHTISQFIGIYVRSLDSCECDRIKLSVDEIRMNRKAWKLMRIASRWPWSDRMTLQKQNRKIRIAIIKCISTVRLANA